MLADSIPRRPPERAESRIFGPLGPLVLYREIRGPTALNFVKSSTGLYAAGDLGRRGKFSEGETQQFLMSADYKQVKNIIAARIILLHSLNLTLWTLNSLLPTSRVNPRAQIVSHALKKSGVLFQRD